MKKMFVATMIFSLFAIPVFAQGIDIESWPPDTDFSQEVHYWSSDGFLEDGVPGGADDFLNSITILNGGDQTTEEIILADQIAVRATNNFMNVADEFFFNWPDVSEVDVLIQYFANADSQNDNMGFLLGVLGNLHGVGGYTLESLTDQFEWRVFRIDNSGQWLGNDLAVDPIPSGGQFGGVNGGTVRIERVNGLAVRAIAIGPAGVFGATDTINQTATVDFDPDLFPIAAEWDLNNGVVDGIDLYKVNDGDQETIESEDIGPAGDKRKAMRPAMEDGSDGTLDNFVNWEILNEHFGPTSQPSTRVKIVAEYYDDPALTGVVFGPEAYSSAGGAIEFFPLANRTIIEGTDKWREVEWFVTDVKFNGVNVPTQGAARFIFDGPVYISRLRMGVIRASGSNEGVDPIPDSYPFDPDPFEIFAELDIEGGIVNGLDFGGNGGDQEYITEEAGPAGEIRLSIRPSMTDGTDPFDRYINFSILDEHFGPSSQPNAVIKIVVDYWDDPALIGESFGPEVYVSNVYGTNAFTFFPSELRTTIEGTDTWQTAAFLIEDMNFSGVNQGPQAAARFWFSDNGAVHISRIRYAVIRPVGVNAGVDLLAEFETDISDWNLY
ncbi:MAG: hypothetical protein P9L94_18105 [Candidatus Hinthialibacter antarcticus]|nr:hypothetical protein [Candidatus Hinthialibacter antarcticus]